MSESKCKICRRAGTKLFLRGERCLSPKCAMIKRAYPPGPKGKRRKSPLSEYGKELREKQKLKKLYNLTERQFSNYAKNVLKKRGKVADVSEEFIRILESRLDNVILRLGLATSRPQARQLVSHGYFLVNGKAINVPSYQLEKGDTISFKPQKEKKTVFKNIKNLVKKYKPPVWLKLDMEKMEGKKISEPTLAEVMPPAEISVIFEFYSR